MPSRRLTPWVARRTCTFTCWPSHARPGFRFSIEHIQEIGERVPLLANLQPHGPYAMVTLHNAGGVPIVMKELLDNGLLHGDAMTVTGETVAENLRGVPSLSALGEQDIVFPVARPVAAPNNHITVLGGNLAPESCVLKLSGKTLEKGEFRGTARVFESEAETMGAIRGRGNRPGARSCRPQCGAVGAPGMPEMVMLTIQLQGRGLGENVALITDGRFSGVSHGILIGHICPEAAKGGRWQRFETATQSSSILPRGRWTWKSMTRR